MANLYVEAVPPTDLNRPPTCIPGSGPPTCSSFSPSPAVLPAWLGPPSISVMLWYCFPSTITNETCTAKAVFFEEVSTSLLGIRCDELIPSQSSRDPRVLPTSIVTINIWCSKSHVHVDDICNAFNECTHKPSPGYVYCIS